MSRNRSGLFGALIAVGALGATAGVLALRWSQRHRAQRQAYHRDLSRWEGEGGALAEAGSGAMPAAAAEAGAGLAAAAPAQANGATGAAWPFPRG